jgi:hypothetical protein
MGFVSVLIYVRRVDLTNSQEETATMDPKACLAMCDQSISDGDLDTATELLREYHEWRARMGFEPIEVAGTLKRGDVFAGECARRLADARL